MSVEQYTVPKNPPKYFAGLEQHTKEAAAGGNRAAVGQVFGLILSGWASFHERFNKPRARKSADERAAAQEARLAKAITKPELWRAVCNSAQVVPELRRAALMQQQALQHWLR